MKCLYISSTRHVSAPYQDGSTRYRCYNFAEELTKLRYIAHVAPIAAVTRQLLEQYDVAIFLRPEMSKELLVLINICEQRNITAIADFDDLIFRSDMADQSPSVLAGRVSSEQMTKTFKRHYAALKLFNRVTVATQTLQMHVRAMTENTHVHHLPNGLSSWWLQDTDELNSHEHRQPHLLYMPGTRSHDHDFCSIANTFQALLSDDSKLKLKVIGPLIIDHNQLAPKFVIRGPEWVEFDQLPIHIGNATGCLAPLADSTFNQCKSHIKFIEAAAFGTPLFASPIPDMEQHKIEGLFFPKTLDDWQEHTRSLSNSDFFNHCSQGLYHYARNNCSNERQLPALLSFFSGQQAKSSVNLSTQPETNHIGYSPAYVTLGSNCKKGFGYLSRLKRKMLKLRQSPKHFVLDSKLCSLYRGRLIRQAK